MNKLKVRLLVVPEWGVPSMVGKIYFVREWDADTYEMADDYEGMTLLLPKSYCEVMSD